MAEDLKSGRPRTNPASGQSGTRTRDRRIAIHSATPTPFLKRLRLRLGHCCRTALSDCFVQAQPSMTMEKFELILQSSKSIRPLLSACATVCVAIIANICKNKSVRYGQSPQFNQPVCFQNHA